MDQPTKEMQLADQRDDTVAPGISVVIITHNRHQELGNAVSSVLSQTRLPRELIIVDDNSQPPVSLEMAVRSQTTLPIRIVRNETAGGPSKARNAGIRAAEGEWIAFLDDDDEFEHEKIEAVCDEIACLNGAVDVLYHPAKIRMVNEGVSYVSTPQTASADRGLFEEMLVKNVVGGTPMVVARRSTLLASGAFDESLRALEDYELWIRLARDGARFHLLARPLTLCNYVTRKVSVTKSKAAGLETFALIRDRYADAFAALPERKKKEHARWIHEIVLHRAILRLEYFATLQAAAGLLFRFSKAKYMAALVSAIFGPKFIIWLRAMRARA